MYILSTQEVEILILFSLSCTCTEIRQFEDTLFKIYILSHYSPINGHTFYKKIYI